MRIIFKRTIQSLLLCAALFASESSTAFYYSDANGNVTAMADGSGQIAARYIYDPFGGLLASSGSLADANLFRFSSKEAHEQSGLVYYLYRSYDSSLQRWLSRDPIGTRGGVNLYAFCRNRSTMMIDPLGLAGMIGGGLGLGIYNVGRNCWRWSCNTSVGANVLLQLQQEGIDGGDDKGGGNAFRHCLATCQSSKTCGSEVAREFWDGRETGGTSSEQQDLANNQVGYANASKSSCWDACMESWRKGDLNCKGKPCPPPLETPPFPGAF